MPRAAAIVCCLVFSGLTALVYQIIWTRLLGLAFGTTTEAISTVLAVFFGGMAMGNWIAARRLERVERPLRLYALLELGIGVFALISLPLLRHLDVLYAWIGTEHGVVSMTLIRIAAAGVVLLPPTLAMGATLPVVARALVVTDASLGRWSAILYAANTLGAVLGAYLCGFWMIPMLGLTGAVTVAVAVNGCVALGVLYAQGRMNSTSPTDPVAATHRSNPPAGVRRSFLAFFAVSGFVAIGYEIVWSRIFGIVMEGTLYGFTTVLSCFLLGIALGSLWMAPFVDRIRDLPRAFGLLHVAIAASVAGGLLAVPYLPHGLHVLVGGVEGSDALHPMFVLVAPIVLLPTALFGAAFPLLIRLYSGGATTAAKGMGLATAVNTAGSIVASLTVGFWAMPHLGIDATLFALIGIDLGVALLVLLGFQESRGRARLAPAGLAAGVLLGLSLSFNGVQVERAIAGRDVRAETLEAYLHALEPKTQALGLVLEGRSSIVTVSHSPTARQLRTNGLPESGLKYAPPYYSLETVLLGVLPYLIAERPERALVIGLGGGNTVTALRRTDLRSIEVVELEPDVAKAVRELYAGRESPLDDPRVELRINDGRNELLLGRHRGGGRWDLIASQPSHPWLQGAANLFTEEFFALARDNLSAGGVFALWVNGFRTDTESLLAVATSFERIFPGSLLVNGVRDPSRSSLLLLGGRRPLRVDPEEWKRRIARPELSRLLALFNLHDVADLLAQLEGPTRAFAAIHPDAANTDDNAFVETRIPRRVDWSELDYASIETALAEDAPVLPPLTGEVDIEAVARSLLEVEDRNARWNYVRKVERLVRVHGGSLTESRRAALQSEARLRDPQSREEAIATLQRLAADHPDEPAPLRALGLHLAKHRRAFRAASEAFAAAWQRSHDAQDAYDAGRSLHHVDPEGAWRFLDKVEPSQRPRFPRLAFYEAERALRTRPSTAEFHRHRIALESYRNTPQGRRFPGVDAVLAQLAQATGDGAAARAYWDADHRQRLRLAAPALDRAQRSLGAGALEEGETALHEATRWLPGDPRVAEIQVRLAARLQGGDGLDAALGKLRHFAASLDDAVESENRLRASLALPLLPDLPARDLLAQQRPPPHP